MQWRAEWNLKLVTIILLKDVLFIIQESNEMSKLDMLIRKRPLEDKEVSEEELKQLQKRERLDLEATSDTNGTCT